MGFIIEKDVLVKYVEESGVTEVAIPYGVTRIKPKAFRDCKHIIGVSIPDSVTNIGTEAFRDCRNLQYVLLSDNISAITGETFRDCYQLEEIKIPDSVKSIGCQAFENCEKLINVKLPKSLEKISNNAFKGSGGFTDLIIPDGVTKIGNGAFERCRLTSLVIPDRVEEIGAFAFYDCAGLSYITIPNRVIEIDHSAFWGCSGIKDVVVSGSKGETASDDMVIAGGILYKYKGHASEVIIPESVTRILDYAFSGCSDVEKIIIPDSVTVIGNGAFSGCANLKKVIIPCSVTVIYKDAFLECRSLESVTFGTMTIQSDEMKKEKEELADAVQMLITKDYSCCFVEIKTKVKYKLILEYFFETQDEKAKAFLKSSFTRILKLLIAENEAKLIAKLLKKSKFVTKKNVGKFIDYASENRKTQIKKLLTEYKEQL